MSERFQEGESAGQRGEHGADQAREQRFQFGPWLFNVSKAQELVAESPRDARPMPVEHWARFYGLTGPDAGSFSLFSPRNLDKDYALTTDLSEPVIIATMRTLGGEQFSLLIDGTHRLYRAHVEGVARLSAYVLSIEETLAIRADTLIGPTGGEAQHD